MTKSTRWILSVSGGLISALPWWGIPGVVLLVSFIPLLFIEADIRKKNEPVLTLLPFSFFFFFTWNLAVCWWMIRIHVLGGLSVISINSALMSVVLMIFSLAIRLTGAGSAVLPVLWSGFEFLHYRGDLSWPWLSIGNGLASSLSIIQWYEFTGVTGGSFWALSVNVLLFTLIKRVCAKERIPGTVMLSLLLVVIVVFPAGLSIGMINRMEEKTGRHSFLIIQPGLDPYEDKFDEVSVAGRLEQLLLLADENMVPGTMYIVTPETSLDSVWITDPHDTLSSRINNFLRQYPGTGLILGATTFGHVKQEDKTFTTRVDRKGNLFDVYNSALFYRGEGTPEVYNKRYLANGVEQIPFQDIFRFLGGLSVDLGGVSGSLRRGDGPRVFGPICPEAPLLGPLICFESAYGEYAAELVRKGAEIIVIISNDGWFKNTGAYRQHLRLSQIRAIETRRSIIRAANTGISCHISFDGSITRELGWWEEGTLSVTAAGNDRMTIYSIYGDFTGRICLFFSLLIILNLTVSFLRSRKFSTG